MSEYSYTVLSPEGKAIMGTKYEQYRYPAEIEAQMLDLGYKIQINGKRLTKKEVADALGKKKKKVK